MALRGDEAVAAAGDDPAAPVLAAYAASLKLADLPPRTLACVREAILDTVGVCTGGSAWEPSRIGLAYAEGLGTGGSSVILDGTGRRTSAATAAFLNGLFSHAIEYDCLRKPGAGVHGAPVVAAALAVAQRSGASGAALIEAVAAGLEVMFRIGRATHHSCETKGFHAPGLTGPFGAAIAVGRLLGLDAQAMTRALGIAGSLASGLLEFARSGDGSMVKKLHLARAAESGVVAAELAAKGMTGPASVLDGGFGFLAVFCAQADPAALAGDLGTMFESDRLCFKRYPCHITAHAPVEAVTALKARHGFDAGDIARIEVACSAKAAKLHNIPRPADMGLAQYSIPFCVAVALLREIADPRHFHGAALADAQVLDLASRIDLVAAPPSPGRDPWAADVTVTLADGRTLGLAVDTIPGTPAQPFTPAQRHEKFMRLAAGPMARDAAERHFARLETLETEGSTGWIGAP